MKAGGLLKKNSHIVRKYRLQSFGRCAINSRSEENNETSNNMTTTFYGFSISNASHEPAWFHSREAAARFNEACGGELGEIETTNAANPSDVLDTLETPWTKE